MATIAELVDALSDMVEYSIVNPDNKDDFYYAWEELYGDTQEIKRTVYQRACKVLEEAKASAHG